MSDYHIQDASPNGFSIRVAFHIPVPTGTNEVGKTYPECLLESGRHTPNSAVPNHATDFPAEADALTNATLIEVVESVDIRWEGGMTKAQIVSAGKAKVEKRFDILTTVKGNEIPLQFKFWGFSGDVA